eukprot:UC1_evm1s1424
MSQAIVCEFGSKTTRVGVCSNAFPDHIVDTASLAGSNDGTSPIERGVIRDWDGLNALLTATLSGGGSGGGGRGPLGSVTEDAPLLFADAITTTDAQRERIAELLFETHERPAVFFAYQPVLGVYSCGRVSSLVVDVGAGVTHAMAVHEGFAFPHTIRRMDLGGDDVTASLHAHLVERGAVFDD